MSRLQFVASTAAVLAAIVVLDVASAADAADVAAKQLRVAAVGASARPVRGGGVMLRWRASHDRHAVGFVLYRARQATPRMRVKLLRRMVAGSVLTIGATRISTRAGRYQRFDAHGRRGDRYFVLAVDDAGRERMGGPYVVRGSRVRRGRNSPLLAPWHAAHKLLLPSRRPRVPVAPPGPPIGPKDPGGVQDELASRQTVLLGVDREGWTRVELATLERYGVDVRHPENLHLYTGGREVAALVRDGGLEFYGRGVDTTDTAARAYYVDAQTVAGVRMRTAPAATSAPAAPDSFAATATRNARTIYFQSLLNGAADNFFGEIVDSSGVAIAVVAPNVASSAGARLTVTLQGVTTSDHDVALSINGAALGTISFAGRGSRTREFAVDGVTAVNSVRLTSSGSGDVALTGPISLGYDHAMLADGDELTPTVPGGRRVRIGGFSHAGARAVDVSDPEAPVALPAAGAGDAVLATAPGDGPRRLHVFSPDAVRAPASVETGMPSALSDRQNDGALTVIAPGGYHVALGPLVRQRRAEGLSVSVAALQDVYDEFSFGQADHTAIRRMLDTARATWRTPPRYVLLGGDGTYDPRGFQQRGTAGNVVPVALIDTSTEAASDSTLTGTLATGRLPARSTEQMAELVAKTLRYGAQAGAGDALLVSDIDDTWNFTGSSNALRPLLPAGWPVAAIERSQPDARARLIAALNTGPSVVNYAGHGSVTFWRGDLLKNADAAGLTNTGRLSFFVMMTCLNGYFVDPTLDALSEALVKAPGGGVAAFSSTASTTPGPQESANQALLAALFGAPEPPRLGDAVVASLSAAGDDEVSRTWTLLGDPTLVVH